MAQPTDKFEMEILPEADLNPLLNPLLSTHMGRWAEVYFTSPPEKRAQAISDLVRELRNEPAAQSEKSQPDVQRRGENIRKENSLPQPEPNLNVQADSADSEDVVCNACSAENPVGQRFCGMCGAPLEMAAQAAVGSTIHFPVRAEVFGPQENMEEIVHEEKFEDAKTGWNEPEPATGVEPTAVQESYSTQYPAEPEFSPAAYVQPEAAEREWRLPENELPHFAVEPEPVSYRYRIYLGIAVAMVLGALIYKGWHSTAPATDDTSESRPSRVVPSAPPRSAPTPAPEASPRTVLPTEGSNTAATSTAPAMPTATSSAPPKRPASPPPAAPVARKAQNPVPSAGRKHEAVRASARKTPAASNPPAPAGDQSGAEELANANKYLNANRGIGHNNAEAAQWLWKAVGKGNLTATMVLSDLYLRGDGIPKSCDQARLLLDVAARKGKAAAGERLRNLPAFGCQ